MKKIILKNLNLEVGDLLQREELQKILGGLNGYDTGFPGGGGHCSNTGCEGKHSGSSCVINGRSGVCREGSCAGSQQLLCYA